MKSYGGKQANPARIFRNRSSLVLIALLASSAVLVGRAVQLQVFNKGFLLDQAAARHLRVATLSAHRGPITDRNGEPLAVSTPVDSLWARPADVLQSPENLAMLADGLGIDRDAMTRRLTANIDKEFLYLRRHMPPADAKQVMKLQIPGVSVLREYRRYYPMGEVTGHLVGFTNIDDEGQEGLERAFDNWLKGEPGRKKVLKDNKGHVIEDVEQIDAPRPGQVLASSIDLRIQYLAYRELKAAVQKHQAVAGTAVVLDVQSGEVLAMVNQPAYNPNDRTQLDPKRYRNRAITDIFEPGSTLKPLVVAAALESGKYRPDTVIDTSPGYIQVSNKLIEDKNNLGRIDLATIIARSSNVGATKLAMGLDRDLLWTVLDRFGLGHLTGSDFPGESAGLLSHHSNWRSISQATLSYGYGVSMTPLQIARAYATLGAGGLDRKVSLVRMDQEPIARKVVSEESARAVLTMMEQVVAPGGTGTPAVVPGYRVAGKTGTALKFTVGGYAEDRYTAMFAGVMPATRPRLAAVVIIDEPRGREYYGGIVAGPVFSAIMKGAMRILSVPPDDFDSLRTDTAGTLAVNSP